MIPPVGAAEEGFEIVGRLGDDDRRRRHQSSHQQKRGECAYDEAQPLEQVEVGDANGFCRSHSEDHGNPAINQRGVFSYSF